MILLENTVNLTCFYPRSEETALCLGKDFVGDCSLIWWHSADCHVNRISGEVPIVVVRRKRDLQETISTDDVREV